MKYSKDVYLKWNPFIDADQDVEIRQYTWELVKTRKPHDCMLAQLVGNEYHEIPKGEFAMREHALVDGEWGSSYSCIGCMDKWLTEEVKPEEWDDNTKSEV